MVKSISEVYGIDVPDSTGITSQFDAEVSARSLQAKFAQQQQQQAALPETMRRIADQQGFVPNATDAAVDRNIRKYMEEHPFTPQQG